jgi:hypothetical protein
MKKVVCALIGASLFLGAVQALAAEPAKFHIGICTGTVSQSEDDLRGAEALIKEYGEVSSGGMIKHITYPDSFMTEQETTISQITAFADDPLMKAVIVNQAVPGTTEAFRRIREKRPDILLFAGNYHEDPGVISTSADLVTNGDSFSRGYLIIKAAQKLGCDTFVHISFPRHMSTELISRRARIMEESCKDLGMKYYFETAPDPTSDVGIAGAQQFILEHVPAWINTYGPKTAFFCTNDAETEPLLKRIAEGQGYFIEADLPSPLMGYPGALGIDLSGVAGDFPAILKKVEKAVVEKGGAGRMGTWAYSFGFTTSYAMGKYAIKCIENNVTAKNFRRFFKINDLLAMYSESTPGAKWMGRAYVDAKTGLELKNNILMYQDTYIFGKGFLHMTDEVVPEKYLKLK